MYEASATPASKAFGAPGIPPKWTSSSKEAVGTAYHTASCVWLTVSHGILNEIYYPTIDRPQIRDMQFLITDGETFFHEERRDLQSRIDPIERDTLGYRIVSRDAEERYSLVKEVIADPHQPCVLINVQLQADPDWAARLRMFALLAPHLEVGGAGNSARRIRVAGRDVLVAWKGGTYLAMGANGGGFVRTSCGYVGASDGWTDLKQNLQMDWEFESALDGNIAVMGQIDPRHMTDFTVGIAFGGGLHAAVTTLLQSLAVPYQAHRKKYVEQWQGVCCGIPALDKFSDDGGRLYRLSHELLLAHEDKTFAGAIIASASIPWGHVKGDEDIGGYHMVWTRDMVNSALGLLACGEKATPRRALVYLSSSQQPDGGFPQNFWLDGTPYWRGMQLDEVAFPIMLAWRLWKEDALGQCDPFPMVKAATAFLIQRAPVTQQERWEECCGYSPSTLAACIAALICSADFHRARGEEQAAAFIEEFADFLESHVEAWTVTTQGSLVPGMFRHYIRIHPADLDDPAANEDPDSGAVLLHNRPPGAQYLFPAKEIVDAGFLELVRYGIRKPGDPLIEDSLSVVDEVLKVRTPFGPCWRRFNNDGYGERPDGGPYEGWGKGRAWPILTGERAHYELACGRDVKTYIHAMERFASKGGMLPEQIWDEPDLPDKHMSLGRPAGSAMPLMWAHAEYVKLLRSVADKKVFDLIPVVADRYLAGKGRKDLEVWSAARRVRRIKAGRVLRVVMPDAFLLHWTADEWRSQSDTLSKSSVLGMEYADVPLPQGQNAPIKFTFYWNESDRWEGRDYEVAVS
jgi:glucoamylase